MGRRLGAWCLSLIVVGVSVFAGAGVTGAAEPLSDGPGAVAAMNGLTAERLHTLLATDDTARVARSGRMFYLDAAPEVSQAPEMAAAAPYPYAQTFALHSNPTAKVKIYLDFDGETLYGTQASADGYLSDDPHTAAPFSIDADPGFSSAEMDLIQDVFLRVAEDYAPFAVDVTTEDPGFEGLNRSSPTDATYGTRTLITNDTWGPGGYAYVGVIDLVGPDLRYQPAWVFASHLSFDPKTIAEVASHESAHTMGLHHDGDTTTDYFTGYDPWAPIMGQSYGQPVTQFSRGEYPGANNVEDDFQVMAGHGIVERPDDHGNTSATATSLTGAATGIISSAHDVDVFRYVASAAGTVTFTVSPAPVSPNLDVRLAAYDLSGGSPVLLGDVNPPVVRVSKDVATGMGASIAVPVTAGKTYSLQVSSGSFRTPTTGFSTYGSVGAYRIEASGPPVIPPDPTSADEAFVRAAYQDFLGRAPSSSELSSALQKSMASTTNRAALVRRLSVSPEWIRVTVDRLYVDTLGRVGDAGGVAYWVGILASKRMTVAQVATRFYTSTEYFQGFGHSNNRVWILDLYAKILLRDGTRDPNGVDYWVGVTNRKGRLAAARPFYDSLESRRTRVAKLYEVLLGRQPDATGRDYWAARIQKLGDLSLAANLAASAECYARAHTRYP